MAISWESGLWLRTAYRGLWDAAEIHLKQSDERKWLNPALFRSTARTIDSCPLLTCANAWPLVRVDVGLGIARQTPLNRYVMRDRRVNLRDVSGRVAFRFSTTLSRGSGRPINTSHSR